MKFKTAETAPRDGLLIQLKRPKEITIVPAPPPATYLDHALVAGLAALMIFGPLAFGAVEDWAIFALRAAATALFLLWGIKQVVAARIEVGWNPLFAPILLFSVLVLAQIVFGISAYRYATVTETLQYLAYVQIFFVATQCFKKEADIKRFLLILGIFGFLLAMFSIVQGLSSNGKLYWVRTVSSGWIYGPYVNHNHYAGLMEMLTPIPLAMCFTRYLSKERKILAGFVAAVMATSIFLSQSRGGVTAFMVEVLLLILLLVRLEPRHYRSHILIAVGAVVTLGLILWIDQGQSFAHILTLKDPLREGATRLMMEKDCVTMFLRRPITGWGLAAFPVIYPEFRQFYTNNFVNFAHNDFLQLLVETGVVGFVLMLWFIVVLYRRGITFLRLARSPWTRTWRAAAIVACTGILVHSFTDFNMHIPANAALFFVFCALATAETGQDLYSANRTE